MLVSAADLLGTAAIAAGQAARSITAAREGSAKPVDDLRFAEAKLVEALSELRAARWGVERKFPQFDDRDLDLLLDAEAIALRSARGCIPA